MDPIVPGKEGFRNVTSFRVTSDAGLSATTRVAFSE